MDEQRQYNKKEHDDWHDTDLLRWPHSADQVISLLPWISLYKAGNPAESSSQLHICTHA